MPPSRALPREERAAILHRGEISKPGETLDRVERDGSEAREVAAAIRLLLLTVRGAGRRRALAAMGARGDRARCLWLLDSKTGAENIPLGRAAFELLMDVERAESGCVIRVETEMRRS